MSISSDVRIEFSRLLVNWVLSSTIKVVTIAIIISGWELTRQGHWIWGFFVAFVGLACFDISPSVKSIFRLT